MRTVNENETQNPSMASLDRSDLAEWAGHEHEHMSKLFDDLSETFRRMAAGQLVGQEQEEALEVALDDLDVALEDMLEHFNEEEEVYFGAIEQHFPELSHALEELVQAHEDICAMIKGLQRQIVVGTSRASASSRVATRAALDVRGLDEQVQSLVGALKQHNEREREVFQAALTRLNQEQLEALRQTKQALG